MIEANHGHQLTVAAADLDATMTKADDIRGLHHKRAARCRRLAVAHVWRDSNRRLVTLHRVIRQCLCTPEEKSTKSTDAPRRLGRCNATD